jgi:hypothetical protein
MRHYFSLSWILVPCMLATVHVACGGTTAEGSNGTTSHEAVACGDAGACSSNEVCVAFNVNLAGHPEQLNDAGQVIPYEGPAFIYDGLGCVPIQEPCDPLSCDCIVCPSLGSGSSFFQCSFPADEGSPASAVASCDAPTA